MNDKKFRIVVWVLIAAIAPMAVAVYVPWQKNQLRIMADHKRASASHSHYFSDVRGCVGAMEEIANRIESESNVKNARYTTESKYSIRFDCFVIRSENERIYAIFRPSPEEGETRNDAILRVMNASLPELLKTTGNLDAKDFDWEKFWWYAELDRKYRQFLQKYGAAIAPLDNAVTGTEALIIRNKETKKTLYAGEGTFTYARKWFRDPAMIAQKYDFDDWSTYHDEKSSVEMRSRETVFPGEIPYE